MQWLRPLASKDSAGVNTELVVYSSHRKSRNMEFVHACRHQVSPVFDTDRWMAMIAWLKSNVGEKEMDWNWNISSIITFRRKEDAVLFELTWGN